MTSTFSFPNFLSKFLSVVSVFIFCEAVLGQPTATKDSVEWKNPFKPDEVDKAIELIANGVHHMRDLSPIWEMYKEGIDLDSVEWQEH